MGKKKKKNANQVTETHLQMLIRTKIHPRKLPLIDKKKFEIKPRSYSCLVKNGHTQASFNIRAFDCDEIRVHLGRYCQTIEHQIIKLRSMTQLSRSDLDQRRLSTQALMNCLLKHHNVIYEGIMFGSTVNGLGFRDSDIDLRLRPLKEIGDNMLEPIHYDKDTIERILRNIAYQTTRCTPALGDFVPSSRCPIAKLTFLTGKGNLKDQMSLIEGSSYDISLSSTNYLGSFNSNYMRFLCHLEPKFNLIASVLRYWSKAHKLIVSGYLSSYALVNMLVFFCQTTSPPLLPTVDQMRDVYLKRHAKPCDKDNEKALLQLEWNCMVSLDKSSYSPSENREPLSVLLLKFFEFYLKFPYSSHILTTRPGRALTLTEFIKGNQYHPKFPIKDIINIQDPFDLKHNLTSGMNGHHFNTLIVTMRYSYERLCKELLTNFIKPMSLFKPNEKSQKANGNSTKRRKSDEIPQENWGLNVIFAPLTKVEIDEAS